MKKINKIEKFEKKLKKFFNLKIKINQFEKLF